MYLRRTAITLAAVVACAGLIWTAGAAVGAWAQGGGSLQPEGVVGPLLQYQGRLTNVTTGNPISSSIFMIFRIYDVPSGGIPLWSETETIQVSNGLFSAVLGDGAQPMDQHMFNGQTLWLEVKVEGEDTSPRQQLLPVAYALGLAPGAAISWTSSAPALLVRNRGAGYALQLEGNLYVSGDLIGGAHQQSGSSITSGTIAEPRIDPLIARDAEVTAAVGAHSAIADAHHPRYTDPEAWSAVLARDGSGSGLDADRVDGLHAGSMVLKVDEGAVPGYGGSYTIAIPHFTPWSLQLSSEWPGSGGLAQVQGFENDGITAITFVKYDGTGAGAAGGAQCVYWTQNPLLQFGTGSFLYTLKCAGTSSDQHQLVLTAAGSLQLRYRLTY